MSCRGHELKSMQPVGVITSLIMGNTGFSTEEFKIPTHVKGKHPEDRFDNSQTEGFVVTCLCDRFT